MKKRTTSPVPVTPVQERELTPPEKAAIERYRAKFAGSPHYDEIEAEVRTWRASPMPLPCPPGDTCMDTWNGFEDNGDGTAVVFHEHPGDGDSDIWAFQVDVRAEDGTITRQPAQVHVNVDNRNVDGATARAMAAALLAAAARTEHGDPAVRVDTGGINPAGDRPVPPDCPPWCELDAGHPYDTAAYDSIEPGRETDIRFHEMGTGTDLVTVCQEERREADGSVRLLAPYVSWGPDFVELDASRVAELAQALQAAEAKLQEINDRHGRDGGETGAMGPGQGDYPESAAS